MLFIYLQHRKGAYIANMVNERHANMKNRVNKTPAV